MSTIWRKISFKEVYREAVRKAIDSIVKHLRVVKMTLRATELNDPERILVNPWIEHDRR